MSQSSPYGIRCVKWDDDVTYTFPAGVPGVADGGEHVVQIIYDGISRTFTLFIDQELCLRRRTSQTWVPEQNENGMLNFAVGLGRWNSVHGWNNEVFKGHIRYLAFWPWALPPDMIYKAPREAYIVQRREPRQGGKKRAHADAESDCGEGSGARS
jgi:hypothetical protein